MKRLITAVPFLLATLFVPPEAHAYHTYNGIAHVWWTDTRPNVILVNNSGQTRSAQCALHSVQLLGPGQAIGCTNPAKVGLFGPDTAGIDVYYCTAQLDCEKSG